MQGISIVNAALGMAIDDAGYDFGRVAVRLDLVNLRVPMPEAVWRLLNQSTHSSVANSTASNDRYARADE